jgi:hypothetical protein
VPVRAQSFRKQVGVIPGQYNQGFSQYFGNTVRIWNRVGSDAPTCGFKRRVVALVSLIGPTMIMPFEAHDFSFACLSAGNAHVAGQCSRAGVIEAQVFNRGQQRT